MDCEKHTHIKKLVSELKMKYVKREQDIKTEQDVANTKTGCSGRARKKEEAKAKTVKTYSKYTFDALLSEKSLSFSAIL